MIAKWLFRRRNCCRVTRNWQDPYEFECSRHSFRTQSPTELQEHMMAEIVETEKALLR